MGRSVDGSVARAEAWTGAQHGQKQGRERVTGRGVDGSVARAGAWTGAWHGQKQGRERGTGRGDKNAARAATGTEAQYGQGRLRAPAGPTCLILPRTLCEPPIM